MTDHHAAYVALQEARAAIEAGNLGLAELAARDAERALRGRAGKVMVPVPVLDQSAPQTD